MNYAHNCLSMTDLATENTAKTDNKAPTQWTHTQTNILTIIHSAEYVYTVCVACD